MWIAGLGFLKDNVKTANFGLVLDLDFFHLVLYLATNAYLRLALGLPNWVNS